jgi:hypothetical protein
LLAKKLILKKFSEKCQLKWVRLKCGSGTDMGIKCGTDGDKMRNGTDGDKMRNGTDMGKNAERNRYGDKMRYFKLHQKF